MLAALTLYVTGCLRGNRAVISTAEQDKQQAEDLRVRDNMRMVQKAAEQFAAGHASDSYPSDISDNFKTYFPGGLEGSKQAPVGPANPFTGVNEFPTMGHIVDPLVARTSPRAQIRPGCIEYSSLAGGKGYAIIGGAHDGKALMDIYNPGDVLVLTNITH